MDEMLALKYRPRTLDDVVGQAHITRVLDRMLQKARQGTPLSNVFLFSGNRGSGKTSCARIVGASLNCSAYPPCGHCLACKDIQEGRSTQVLEIDSATTSSVDDVKQVIAQVRYVSDGYMVVIFDEVHMISKAGFNSMLKTFEEGIPNVLFILATTEPQKIPIAVLSRSMPFHFTTIRPDAIELRLRYVLNSEGIDYDPHVLPLITQEASGAMRDALMLVDQLKRGYGSVSMAGYQDLFGNDPAELFIELIDMMYEFSMLGIDTAIDKILSRISDPMIALERWVDFELRCLRKDDMIRFAYPHSEQDILKCLELLWFLTEKIRVLNIGAKTFLRLGALLMSARLTKRILDTDEAFALLGL